jgi:hypothetical protein
VTKYAADVYSYWTSPAESRLWGGAIRAFPKAEGDLFPSITALVLAAIGIVAGVRAAWARSRGPAAAIPALTIFVFVVAAGCALYALFLVFIISGHGFANIGPVQISVRSVARNFQILLVALIVLLASSPRARSFAGQWAGHVAGFAVLLTLATFLMSLGPEITTMGRSRGVAPYAFFYWHVPGFDGLRVPARYGMLTMMFLGVVAGFGALELERRFRRAPASSGRGGLIVSLLGLFVVAESIAAPITINGTGPTEADYVTPPAFVTTGDRIPLVYRFLKTLPSSRTVVAEFPFGEYAYELRYLFYSMAHWHPLINGYSGTFPLSYDMRAAVLRRPDEDPERAWNLMATSGVTHAVVHEGVYKEGRGRTVSVWLASHGAHLVAEFDGDKVFVLQPTTKN